MKQTATFVEEYADYLEAHIEDWTVTTIGSLLPGTLHILHAYLARTGGPGASRRRQGLSRAAHRQSCVRRAERLSRWQHRRWRLSGTGPLWYSPPDDPTVIATIKVIDAVLKTDTPAGPTWHRYNHDGYGQQQDGGPFTQHGVGRVWPLLTGERGHYELAAGRSTETCIRTMEALASKTGLLPGAVLGSARPARDFHVARPAHRFGNAADVGSCRVHQASPLHIRRQSLRRHPGGRQTLSRQA